MDVFIAQMISIKTLVTPIPVYIVVQRHMDPDAPSLLMVTTSMAMGIINAFIVGLVLQDMGVLSPTITNT